MLDLLIVYLNSRNFFLNSRIRQIHLLVKGQNRFRKACSKASFWVPERNLCSSMKLSFVCFFFLRFLSSFSFTGRGVGSNALSSSQLMNKSASNPLNKSGSRYQNLSSHLLYPLRVGLISRLDILLTELGFKRQFVTILVSGPSPRADCLPPG